MTALASKSRRHWRHPMGELRSVFADHYPAKLGIQRLGRLRLDHPLVDEMLSHHPPIALEVFIGESSCVGDRAHYDRTGCVHDMTSHLMQVIAHAMTGLASRDGAETRERRREALLALVPADGEVNTRTVLGQYLGYTEEPGVASDSLTPTFFLGSALLDPRRMTFWPWRTIPTLRLGSGKG